MLAIFSKTCGSVCIVAFSIWAIVLGKYLSRYSDLIENNGILLYVFNIAPPSAIVSSIEEVGVNWFVKYLIWFRWASGNCSKNKSSSFW